MVAVEQPRADCGHVATLTQQCGRCLRWCCPECYAPWTALACGACRAEARAAAGGSYAADSAATTVRALVEPPPVIEVESEPLLTVGRQPLPRPCPAPGARPGLTGTGSGPMSARWRPGSPTSNAASSSSAAPPDSDRLVSCSPARFAGFVARKRGDCVAIGLWRRAAPRHAAVPSSPC